MPEIDLKMQRLQIRCRRPVNELLAGEYLSVFRGRGVEFDEVREYTPGDDVRSIDWNVTARTGVPHIKRYIEERELCVYFLVDISASKDFGSTGSTKREAAAEIAALLAFSAIKNNDRVGLILFSDAVEHHIPPGKGQSHALRIIEDIFRFPAKSQSTDIATALDHLALVSKRGGLTFLISDFHDEGYGDALLAAAQRQELIAISVTDPGEEHLPPIGLTRIRDSETGKHLTVDAASQTARQTFAANTSEHHHSRLQIFEEAGVDHLQIPPGSDYPASLHAFLKSRIQRVSHG